MPVLEMVNGELISTSGNSSRKVPSGVTTLTIEGWGGGGRGASVNGSSPGSGGGAGAYFLKTISVTPGQVIPFSIGTGDSTGADGGATTCDSASAGGGQAGAVISLQGSGLTISNAFHPVLGGMTSTMTAFFDANIDSLRAYTFNGSTWSLTGSGLNISVAAQDGVDITGLTSSSIAFVDNSAGTLRTYSFNGSSWSLTGSALSISSMGAPRIASLTSTRIAFYDPSVNQIRAYDFDGTNWSQVGTGLNNPAGGSTCEICSLSSTRIAFFYPGAELRCYEFNGSSWSLVGSGLSISATSCSMAKVSDSTIVFWSESLDVLRFYTFDGSNWSPGSFSLAATGNNNSGMTSMGRGQIAFMEAQGDQLRMYTAKIGSGGLASGGDTNTTGADGELLTGSPTISGDGGDSPNAGSGGVGVSSGNPGNPGSDPGGAGSGAGISSTPGSGANGGIRFTW